MRVKCLAEEHNTMSPARARTRTAQSGDERTNHEATVPPTSDLIQPFYFSLKLNNFYSIFYCFCNYSLICDSNSNNIGTCEKLEKEKACTMCCAPILYFNIESCW